MTKNDGDKCVYLIELSVENADKTYEHGDVALIKPRNDYDCAEEILKICGFDKNEEVEILDGQKINLFSALIDVYDLSEPKSSVIVDKTASKALVHFLKKIETPQQLISILKPIRPRAYSIASSRKVLPNSVELIVALASYVNEFGEAKNGLASGFLCKRAKIGETISVDIKNSHFKLPADKNAGVIMIGPGAGIAPFKGFLEEREAVGANGGNWLFFGDRHRANDFILEENLTNYEKSGFLTLDLAFSRDQAQKVYVQHKILENAKKFWQWIESGAYIYVCGDAKNMAKDVESAIIESISKFGNMTQDEAKSFLANLKKLGRYQKDVY